jgi:transcriptional regulator with XRE-family HTH domain
MVGPISKKDRILKDFGANLARMIDARFKSRDAFLDGTDIYKANLSRIISGKDEPKLFTLYKIAERLKVDIRELFPQ